MDYRSGSKTWTKEFASYFLTRESICAVINLIIYQLSRGIDRQKSGRWSCHLNHPFDHTFTYFTTDREMFQKLVCQIASSPSPHRWCTSSILSTDLHMPLQLQSNDAAQGFPAWAFHSQSVSRNLTSTQKEIFWTCWRIRVQFMILLMVSNSLKEFNPQFILGKAYNSFGTMCGSNVPVPEGI